MNRTYVEIELGEIAEHIRNGLSIKQTKEKNGLPITRIETIWNEAIDSERVGYAGIHEGEKEGWFLNKGDILISHINSKLHLGKCALYKGFPEKLIHGMNLLCLRPKHNKVIPDYLIRVLQSFQFKSKIPSITKDSVNQSSFNVTNFKKLTIPLPPLPEQKRIAAILDKADAIRRKRRQAITLADDFLRATFLDMFGDPVTNPKGWEVKPLNNFASFENGDRSSSYPSGNDIKQEGVLFVSTKNIFNSTFSLNETRFITEQKFASLSRGKLKKGDLLITLRGTLGGCCIFDSKYETGFINAQIMIIRPKKNCNNVFLHAMLTSKPIQENFQKIGQGAAVPQLTGKQINELKLPFPPLEMQKKFARLIKSTTSLQEKMKNKGEEYLFNSLTQRAFRGEL